MAKDQLALRIRAFRKLKGYTQDEMSELLGVSIAILGSIERGTRRPDKHILQKIGEVLNIDQDELLGQ
ncbi:MAG: helix-turn-helix transcriptional regulator [Paenibacillaceae bacterium]